SLVDEVVVVDNASTDRTAEVARAAGARVVFEARKGYGRAYKTGFAAARGDVIVTMDGDGTYPPDSIPLLLYVLLEERVDFISARRWHSRSGESKSPLRLLGNAILSGATVCLFFRFIIDSQSGMWVFRRDVLKQVEPHSDGMALSEELKILAFTHPTLRCLEMPIYYGERIGESKLNLWKDGFTNLVFLAKMRLTLGRRRGDRRDGGPVARGRAGARAARRGLDGGAVGVAPRPRLLHEQRGAPLRRAFLLAVLGPVLDRARAAAAGDRDRLGRTGAVPREHLQRRGDRGLARRGVGLRDGGPCGARAARGRRAPALARGAGAGGVWGLGCDVRL